MEHRTSGRVTLYNDGAGFDSDTRQVVLTTHGDRVAVSVDVDLGIAGDELAIEFDLDTLLAFTRDQEAP